ncbi:P-loop containing nucleoside triphosphate hydrolase protein [Xylariales sp. PMI_506]|nr:P-loop containing nucleoside triphosphate hydrolase protein [Xylariales sp. PMI_506]
MGHRECPIPENRQPNPEYRAGFFSLLTFSWMSSIMATGYRRPLELNDIWLLHPRRQSRNMAAELKKNFQALRQKGTKRPLSRAIVQTFKTDLIIGALAAFTSAMSQVLIPFVVKYIVAFAVQEYEARQLGVPGPPIGRGIGLVFGIAGMQILGSIGYNHLYYRGMLVGGQVRAALISTIFDKAMTISGRAKAAWGNGRIVNLMSVDTSRIDQAYGWLHMAWATPLTLVVTIVLLLINLSYSALAGIGLFFSVIPIMAHIVRTVKRRRAKVNKDTDERISMTQEVLQAIRFIKYYAWEADFVSRLDAVRHREIRGIRFLLSHRNAAIVMGQTIPIFSSMLTFITFSLTNHALEPSAIFSSLALFNQLRLPLVIFPMAIGLIIDALQSLARIEQFLLAEDYIVPVIEGVDGSALNLADASFTWEQTTPSSATEPSAKGGAKLGIAVADSRSKETEFATDIERSSQPLLPFTLSNINLQLQPSELIGVVGSVGSGKTSLLSAIAGDMRQTAGVSEIRGKRAFCAQVPWIQNGTVRDNISFGAEFVEDKYNAIVAACSLDHDLRVLPHGSLTEIGERGINLSGGQKHRISLARAIYFDAEIILLDDPLAAVDPHVGVHLMEHAICGLLKDKCRILATHQLQVLPRCDRILIMDNGRVLAFDTFQNLMNNNKTFQKMMAGVNTQSEKEQRQIEEDPSTTTDKIIADEARQVVQKSKVQEALMQEEDRQMSGISKEVYLDYWRSTGSLFIPALVLFTLVIAQGANIMTNLWLAWWSADKFNYSNNIYIGVYAAIGLSQGALLLTSSLGFTIFGTRSSRIMLHRAVKGVLRAPVSFFDTTPLGRIMNRFSRDVDVMDNTLSESLRSASGTVAMIISIMILTIAYYYYFAAALVPLCVVYLLCAAYYRSSALGIKRHEAVLRSAVFSRFNEAIIGTSTIRAYGVQDTFSKKLTDAIDEMNSAYFLTFANQRWLGVRLDAIGVVFLIVTGLLVVTNQFTVSPSISGLVLSYLVSITQSLLLAVRQVADSQNNMNSVERMHYYATDLAEEAPEKTTALALPASWPQNGHIVFNDVQMRYRDGLPLVLHGLSFDVSAGERIGIVGRTGAGKSSIMAALFRIMELAGGSITIDGLDISTIGLTDLRSRLSIIPQDPTLFRGTVRSNLDPFGQHTDLDLWTALRRAHLLDDSEAPVQSLDDDKSLQDNKKDRITLESIVEPDGSNLSLGQRQLMGLARALVRDSRIIVCDEATSSIDFESDRKVQETMAQGFRGKTILCIAHRLKTIIGYDRICVIDNGRVAELGAPLTLFDEGGRFRAMCDQSQIARGEVELAQQ